MLVKKITILTVFAFSSIAANAQDDLRAKKILDELSVKTKSYATIKAEFSWTIEKKDKSKEISVGKIAIKGGKYKLEIPGHEIYCDNKTVWDLIKDANEVQVKDIDVGDDVVNPSTIFTIYEKGFHYKFESEDAKMQVINLFPANPDKRKFHTIKLYIDKIHKQISTVKIMMKDGGIQTYSIKTFVVNSVIVDSDFVFDTKSHKGTSVEDLR